MPFLSHNTSKQSRGFTLLEMLVVTAVIGILATVVVGSVSAAREQARIARIITDIKEIERALVTYRSEYLDLYPRHAGSVTASPDLTIEALIAGTSMIDLNEPEGDTDRKIFEGLDLLITEAPSLADEGLYYSFNNFGVDFACGDGASHRTGVSIRIGDIHTGLPPNNDLLNKLYETMEETIDVGVTNIDEAGAGAGTVRDPGLCGRVRRGGPSASIYYLISASEYDMGI